MATKRELDLVDALRATLEWIDAVPQDTVLPAMPGFDRDWVDGLVQTVEAEVPGDTTSAFIQEYIDAYQAANGSDVTPKITKRTGGWYDITPSSGGAYRKADIIKMAQTLRNRVARGQK